MNQEKQRWGYTTGTCAQAATKAAIWMLLAGERKEQVTVELPKGRELTLDIRDMQVGYAKDGGRLLSWVSCAVQKDSGDDPDITNGVLVYSRVEKVDKSGITLEGGRGIGKVIKPGLEQQVGEAAINRVPRQMIVREVKEVCEEVGYTAGICVEISIPGGEKLAQKTFNPRLGIEGGLSILGTSGMVEPMSEKALLDTIRLEMQVKIANGRKFLVVTPGNYGLAFLKKEYGIREKEIVKCSNYIGETIDMAAKLGCQGMVLAGHVGKLVKVAGGIMNTHSKWADCRMEILAAAALRAGLDGKRARTLLDCVTTDDALEKCTQEERRRIMGEIMNKMEDYLTYRAAGKLQIGAVVFSNVYGILGKTGQADALMQRQGR